MPWKTDHGRMRLSALLVVLVGCSAGSSGAGDAELRQDTGATADVGTRVLGIYASGTRLRMRVGTTPDGAKSFEGWRDTARNEDCSFVPARDGQRRCLPIGSPTTNGNYYDDATCTKQIAGWLACGRQLPATTISFQAGATCGISYAVYTRGAQFINGGVYYTRGVGTCTATPIPAGTEMYYLGSEIPPTDFVAMTVSVE